MTELNKFRKLYHQLRFPEFDGDKYLDSGKHKLVCHGIEMKSDDELGEKGEVWNGCMVCGKRIAIPFGAYCLSVVKLAEEKAKQ